MSKDQPVAIRLIALGKLKMKHWHFPFEKYVVHKHQLLAANRSSFLFLLALPVYELDLQPTSAVALRKSKN